MEPSWQMTHLVPLPRLFSLLPRPSIHVSSPPTRSPPPLCTTTTSSATTTSPSSSLPRQKLPQKTTQYGGPDVWKQQDNGGCGQESWCITRPPELTHHLDEQHEQAMKPEEIVTSVSSPSSDADHIDLVRHLEISRR